MFTKKTRLQMAPCLIGLLNILFVKFMKCNERKLKAENVTSTQQHKVASPETINYIPPIWKKSCEQNTYAVKSATRTVQSIACTLKLQVFMRSLHKVYKVEA